MIIIVFLFFSFYIKISKDSCARYYKKKKKKLSWKSRKCLVKSIDILLEKKKNRKREYGHKRYENLEEAEKQRLVEYRKRHYEMWKYEKTVLYYYKKASKKKMY